MSTDETNPRMDPACTALLVVDVQQGLFERSAPIYRAEQLISNINSLIRKWHENHGLVVFIQHANQKILLPGSIGWQIHEGLMKDEADPVVHKEHGNAFQDTSLKELLDAQGVTDLVVTGLVSHGCVRATCLGGIELGYRVILAADGHSSWRKDAAELTANINLEMKNAGAAVIPAESITSV